MTRPPARPSRSAGTSPRRRQPRVAAPSRSARTRELEVHRRSQIAMAPLPPGSLGGYPFPELTTQWAQIPRQAGLFAILERVPTAEVYRPLFLGEAGDMHAALTTLHRRAILPGVRNPSLLVYAALATTVVRAARQQMVTTLRALYQLPTPLTPVRSQGAMAPADIAASLPRSRRRTLTP